jgi:hypothetical protein
MGPTERYLSIPRSDLAAVIYDALCGGVELILNDTVHVLETTEIGFESTSKADKSATSTS